MRSACPAVMGLACVAVLVAVAPGVRAEPEPGARTGAVPAATGVSGSGDGQDHTAAAGGGGHVILISMDGVGADLVAAVAPPGFSRLEREGARAERLQPPFPPLTFPSHVTLATGAPVDRHAIVANAFLDPERGLFRYQNDPSWQEAEPIWAAAERQGVRSAVFFWVGSEGPWRDAPAPGDAVAPFDSDVPESEKVDRILAWLDRPPEERPRLVLSWWHGADAAGHRHGPDAPAVREALLGQDAQLVRLLDGIEARGLWDDLTLLVVSDHGMAAASEPIDAGAVLSAAGIEARVLPSGGMASVHLEDEAQREAARAALEAVPGVRAYPPDALPERWRYGPPARVGDLVAVTEPPRAFVDGTLASVATRVGYSGGAHGYDPARADMAAILYAKGRGVLPGARLGTVAATDVAPTVARLLGIDPPRQSEGRPIPQLAPPTTAGGSGPGGPGQEGDAR